MKIYDLDHLESIDKNTSLVLNGGGITVTSGSTSTAIVTKDAAVATNVSYGQASGGTTYTSVFTFLNTRPQGSGFQASAGSSVTAIAIK